MITISLTSIVLGIIIAGPLIMQKLHVIGLGFLVLGAVAPGCATDVASDESCESGKCDGATELEVCSALQDDGSCDSRQLVNEIQGGNDVYAALKVTGLDPKSSIRLRTIGRLDGLKMFQYTTEARSGTWQTVNYRIPAIGIGDWDLKVFIERDGQPWELASQRWVSVIGNEYEYAGAMVGHGNAASIPSQCNANPALSGTYVYATATTSGAYTNHKITLDLNGQQATSCGEFLVREPMPDDGEDDGEGAWSWSRSSCCAYWSVQPGTSTVNVHVETGFGSTAVDALSITVP